MSAENNNSWIWVCPICHNTIHDSHSLDTIQDYVGATYNCPECGGDVLIQKDFTCIDFGDYLVNAYKSMGVNVSKNEALGNYIEVQPSKGE